MKKLLTMFALLILSLFVFTACNIVPHGDGTHEDESKKCSHIYDNECDADCNECSNLRVVNEHIDADNSGYCDKCGEINEGYFSSLLVYKLSADGNYYIVVDYDDSATEIVIPTIHDGKPVKEIGQYAFMKGYENGDPESGKGEANETLTKVIIKDGIERIGLASFGDCINLTSVTIGDSVTSIGDKAFAYCTSLTSVTIPDSVASIGDEAFYNCTSLTSVTIPDSVTSIGDRAFYNCDSLTSVTIGDSVTSIGYRAFEGCHSLTSVTIPDSVTSIGGGAFSNCHSLTSIAVDPASNNYSSFDGDLYSKDKTMLMQYATGKSDASFAIPDTVTSIGDRAFAYCYNLMSVTIGDSVTSIGDRAFAYCTSLTSVTVPDSVTSIGDYAFMYCTDLTSVYYHGTAAEWDEISIDSGSTSFSYSTRYYYSETEPTDEGNYWHYDEDGNIAVWGKE